MNFTNVDIEGKLFDFYLNENHPTVANALELMSEEGLFDTLVRAMHMGGLTYENLDEMNKGGSWCIASKAASIS